jgi:hypothetical protein
MRQVGIYTVRVIYWKNRDQGQRWIGTALQEIEPKLRAVRGYRHLREAMKGLNFKENIIKVARGIVQFQLTMGLCPNLYAKAGFGKSHPLF